MYCCWLAQNCQSLWWVDLARNITWRLGLYFNLWSVTRPCEYMPDYFRYLWPCIFGHGRILRPSWYLARDVHLLGSLNHKYLDVCLHQWTVHLSQVLLCLPVLYCIYEIHTRYSWRYRKRNWSIILPSIFEALPVLLQEVYASMTVVVIRCLIHPYCCKVNFCQVDCCDHHHCCGRCRRRDHRHCLANCVRVLSMNRCLTVCQLRRYLTNIYVLVIDLMCYPHCAPQLGGRN